MKTKLFRSFLLSTVVGATTILFLSPLAEAVTLRRESETDQVLGIDGLEVFGETYNVDFVFGSFRSVYASSTPLFLGDRERGIAAAEGIIEALGDSEEIDTIGGDSFFLAFDIEDGPFGISVVTDRFSQLAGDFLEVGSRGGTSSYLVPWAVMSPAAAPSPRERESTPEPSLILGFITLGGVMLGSRNKKKA